MNKDFVFEEKLQLLFLQLRKDNNPSIEDDTVLQKLQSSLQKHIELKEKSLVWCDHVGLITYISESLKKDCIQVGKDSSGIAFALHCFSCLVAKEDNFCTLSQNEILVHFKQALPFIRENLSLTSNALKVADSLISHPSGLKWTIDNGIWENLLICSLKSQSIFVQRGCITVIVNLLMKVKDQKKFADLIGDLELVLYKLREVRHKLEDKVSDEEDSIEYSMATTISNLKTNTHTILLVFHDLLLKTLGLISLYTQLQKILDLTSKILFRFNFDMKPDTVIFLCKMLILSILHKFQGKCMNGRSSEQECLDSIASDVLSLTKMMINKKYHPQFLLASFEVHKYWKILLKNNEDRKKADISKGQSIVFVFLKFQMVALRTSCSASLLDMGDEEFRQDFERNYYKWKKATLAQMFISEEHKLELMSLMNLLKQEFSQDVKMANEHCITHLLYCSAIIEDLQPASAFILLQMLIFILKFKIEATSTIEYNPRFYLNAVYCLRLLIDRFDIDWTNCYESKTLVPMLCSVVWIPGITTRVKVSILQTLNTCVQKLIPPLTTNSSCEKSEEATFAKLEETITIYLSDMEWEVRDSALELVHTCMILQKKKGDFLSEWFLRNRLLDHVLQGVGDVEPYVQATALTILSEIVSVDMIWSKLEGRGLKQKALRAVVRSGESCIMKAGLKLLHELIFNSKFQPDEVDAFVMPTVQAASGDADDEIRFAALKFIHQHLDMELMRMGMVDGAFPKVTFQQGKVTQLENEEVLRRVNTVICSFCHNGYFGSVINCSDDNSRKVATEANSIICFIGELLKKYNLTLEIISCLDEHNPTVLHPMESVNEENGLASAEPADSSTMVEEKEIKYILETSDLTVISGLENKSSLDWWNGDASEILLRPDEIPAKNSSVTTKVLFKELAKAANAALQLTDDDSCESEITQLLEDIFLVTGAGLENEARARDCY